MKLRFSFPLLFVAALMICFSACIKEHDDLVPTITGVPSGGVYGLNVINVVDNKLQVDVSIFAVDHFGNFIDGLTADNFRMDNTGFSDLSYRIIDVAEKEDVLMGDYSAALLFDQSGSINTTDPGDVRITAGVSFADLISGNDEAAVAAFSDGGFYQRPYELLSNFNRDKGTLNSAINSLAGKADGGTPLFQAIYNLIPYVAADGQNENKAIVAFTDGEDTEAGVTINSIIELACAEGVRVYTVGLSNGVDQTDLGRIALGTGGAVMLAEDAIQLVSLYSSLGELLHGQGKFYTVRLEIENNSSVWSPGQIINSSLNIKLSEEYSLNYPLAINLTYENSGDLNQRVPNCLCTEIFPDDLISNWKKKAMEYAAMTPADPDLPNEEFTCAYANIYHENPTQFKWAGLAAIVSGIVGEKSDDFAMNTWFTTEFRDSILAANKAIFEDLFWKHLAFQEKGIAEIEKIYCFSKSQGTSEMSLEVYRAWLKIAQNDADNIWKGTEELLYHEQFNVAQNIMYAPFGTTWGWAEAGGHVVSPVPNHDNEFPGSDVEMFEQRWNWITTSILPEWRKFESNPSNASLLKTEHKKYCPSCCN